jgi:hypothetical protein
VACICHCNLQLYLVAATELPYIQQMIWQVMQRPQQQLLLRHVH